MLSANDKEKLQKRIDDIISDLENDIKGYNNFGLSQKQTLDRVVSTTVNRITPESKMLLNSVCNMLETNTFNNEIYQDTAIKSAYYDLDIRSNYLKKFSFEVPQNIDYQECETSFNKLVACGSVVIVGGTVSIATKSLIPICIAVVLAGVMALVIKKREITPPSEDIISDYLNGIKQMLMLWVESVNKSYDESITKFEEQYRR